MLNSSLGEQFRGLGWRCCVDAFHGYTHGYDCQLRYHPTVVKGMGLEDLETLERIFSSSNQLASVTRYSSKYNRHQAIELFFKQWDEDKYLNLVRLLYDRYRRALSFIANDVPVLEEYMASANISYKDLERWENEEREYIATLGQEPEWDVFAVAYVELLQQLQENE